MKGFTASQPWYHSDMVCILTSPRVSANSPKSKQTSAVIMVWVCSHMPCAQPLQKLKMHYICMTCMWDALWKVFPASQPKRDVMVCTLTSHRVSANANSPKFEQTSVVITVWVCRHMQIHNRCRCSNTLYMYDMDVGCILNGSTAFTVEQWHGLHTYITY